MAHYEVVLLFEFHLSPSDNGWNSDGLDLEVTDFGFGNNRTKNWLKCKFNNSIFPQFWIISDMMIRSQSLIYENGFKHLWYLASGNEH